MKKGMILAVVVCIMTAITIPAQAGDLYDELYNMNHKQILFELFQKESFSPGDIVDLELLFAENENDFTDTMIANEFRSFQKEGVVPVAVAYQEVWVYHKELNLFPLGLLQEVLDALEIAIREKAGMFEGSVRLVGIFVDENGQGACRWSAPNAFLVMYVVREVLGTFPVDGAGLVTQVM